MTDAHPQLPDPRRPQADGLAASLLGPEGYARHGVHIPECPACNGYGFEDGQPARGWKDHARPGCPACGATGEGLDELTRTVTAFQTFRELLEAPGGYRPTLWTKRRDCDPLTGEAREQAGKIRALADAYDQAQANRGSDRRAYRGW